MQNLTPGQKRLFILLAIVLAYAVFDFVKNKDQYLGFYTKKENARVEKAEQQADSLRTVRVRQVYQKAWKSDPFYMKLPPKTPKKKPAKRRRTFRLKAISFSGESAVAMINNRIVSVGDWIGGYKVLKIEPRRVILGRGSEAKVLTLKIK